MTPEEFIRNNPFPEEKGVGEAINNQLVKDINDPTKKELIDRNLYKLLKNNARLIYMVYHQYNYNQSLSSIMSFLYEGLKKSATSFDPTVGTKFYQYAVQTTRGLLQNYYNYNDDLIHIPVKKRKVVDKFTGESSGVSHDFCDVNDYSESQYLNSYVDNEEPESLSNELDMIITEYENQPNLTADILEELEIFKMARHGTLKDVATKTGKNTVKLRKILDNITLRLKKHYIKIQRELY